MTKRIAFALSVAAFAAPAAAEDAFSFYYDRYAVVSSTEPVPADSDTSPFHRSRYAVMTGTQAAAVAAARVAPELDDRATRRGAGCACECERGS